MTVAERYQYLKENPSGHMFTVTLVPGWEDVYIGVDTAGHPCLFVRANDVCHEPSLRTAHVSLRFSQQYHLAEREGPVNRGLFNSLHCESILSPDVDTFLVLIEAFLARHEGQPVVGDSLTTFFRSMLRLFTVNPAKDLEHERLGLWGELFIMSRVRGFQFWASFWHSETTRRFDFSTPNHRVEVKTTLGTERIHHFSHRQIYAQEGEEILIASLLVRKEDSGLSLRNLIDECREVLLGSPHSLKLERAVRSAGMEDPSEIGPVFDPAEAERSLAWFRSTDAPHFRMPEPPGVSETRYKVDLSMAPRIELEEVDVWLDSWVAESPLEPVGSRPER